MIALFLSFCQHCFVACQALANQVLLSHVGSQPGLLLGQDGFHSPHDCLQHGSTHMHLSLWFIHLQNFSVNTYLSVIVEELPCIKLALKTLARLTALQLRPKTNKNIWGRKLSNMGDMWRHSSQHFACPPLADALARLRTRIEFSTGTNFVNEQN